MEKTKGHICPTCAGQLKIDEDRKLYLCPFCGVTFDYEYFREDDVLDRGATNLSNGEFNAATEAYKFMLAKDPHNFEALRGLLFAAAGIKDFNDLMDIDKVAALNYKSSRDELQLALSDAEAADKPFFEAMEEILSKGGRYSELTAENKKLSDERKAHYREIDRQNQVADIYMWHIRDYNNGTASVDPKKALIIALSTWGGMSLVILLLTKFSPLALPYLGICGVPCIIIAVVCALKLRSLKGIMAVINERHDAIEKINDQLKANDDACTKLRGEIRTLVHKLDK